MEKARLKKKAQQLLKKRVRGIPLILILLLCTVTVVGATAAWFTINTINQLDYTGDQPPTSYADGTLDFEILDTFTIPNILEVTTTLTGVGRIGERIDFTVLVELIDPTYTLESSYGIRTFIDAPTGQILSASGYDLDGVAPQLSATNPTYTYTSIGTEVEAFITALTVTEIGTYTIRTEIYDMDWSTP